MNTDASNTDASDVDESPMATRWCRALAAWGIPQPILDAATRDPWGFPVARFASRADRAVADRAGVSYDSALAALGADGATVLDVGAGAGAASLPLAGEAAFVTAVDDGADMLAAFDERATALGVAHQTVQGSWPGVAGQVEVHDLVVAHHVVYNVPAIGAFVRELTNHARRRVVLELPPRHPLSWMNPLWELFHGISRPSSPTADDLVNVLREQSVDGLDVQNWTRSQSASGDGCGPEESTHRIALVTRRLCLAPEREPEVAAALGEIDDGYNHQVVTISWSGVA